MRKGDRQELQKLMRYISEWTFNMVLAYVQNQEDAEEVVQDTAIKVIDVLMDKRKGSSFQENSSLKTWVYRIAINGAKDMLRYRNQKKRKGKVLSIHQSAKDSMQPFPEPATYQHPGILLEQSEDVNRLWSAIFSLPETQRDAILLTKIDGHSMKSVAVFMDTTPKAIESLLSRARQNLKKLIQSK